MGTFGQADRSVTGIILDKERGWLAIGLTFSFEKSLSFPEKE